MRLTMMSASRGARKISGRNRWPKIKISTKLKPVGGFQGVMPNTPKGWM
ncbi:MAG: hypothetical protein ACAH24_22980 [Hyphomicrobiaceae bacterium]